MSEYLKWCESESHLTTRENLAKNELESAHRKIKHATESLAKANERVRELEVQLKRLVDYGTEQSLLPEASFKGARELVNDIKNDAIDAGGCYEVSCGLLDSLFERYTDKGSSKLLNKFAIEKKAEAFNAVKNEIKTVGGLELCDVTEFIDEQLEQLRKEQSHD